MVQCYSTGDGNVSSHEGTLAPPGECDWICASFGPLESIIQTANQSVKPFWHSSRQKVPIIYNGRPYPPELPLKWRIWTPCNTWCLGPMRAHNPNGTSIGSAVFSQMTAECPYTLQLFACFPSKLPLPMLASGPCNTWFIGPTESKTQMATWSFQPFLQGSLVWQTDRATKRPTDRPRYSVRYGVIMRRPNHVGYGIATHSFHVSANNFATIKLLSERLKYLIS